MSRIIKFRVWYPQEKRFYHTTIENSPSILGKDAWDEPYVIEQFTGVQDSNQKDIYEGDIVKFDKDTYQIIWSEEDVAFISINKTNMAGAFLTPLYVLNFEIIGNIHETPELMP